MKTKINTHIKIGRMAVCSAGRIGYIEEAWLIHNQPINTILFTGTGIDGKPWISKNPRLIAKDQEVLFS